MKKLAKASRSPPSKARESAHSRPTVVPAFIQFRLKSGKQQRWAKWSLSTFYLYLYLRHDHVGDIVVCWCPPLGNRNTLRPPKAVIIRQSWVESAIESWTCFKYSTSNLKITKTFSEVSTNHWNYNARLTLKISFSLNSWAILCLDTRKSIKPN